MSTIPHHGSQPRRRSHSFDPARERPSPMLLQVAYPHRCPGPCSPGDPPLGSYFLPSLLASRRGKPTQSPKNLGCGTETVLTSPIRRATMPLTPYSVQVLRITAVQVNSVQVQPPRLKIGSPEPHALRVPLPIALLASYRPGRWGVMTSWPVGKGLKQACQSLQCRESYGSMTLCTVHGT